MVTISVVMNADGQWPELREKIDDGTAQWFRDEARVTFGVIPGGMASGKPAVAIRVDMPDGKVVVVETSWRLLRTTVDAISARYGSGGD